MYYQCRRDQKPRPVELHLTVGTLPRASDKLRPFRPNWADLQYAHPLEVRTSSSLKFSTVDHISIGQSLAVENGVCVVVSHLPLKLVETPRTDAHQIILGL